MSVVRRHSLPLSFWTKVAAAAVVVAIADRLFWRAEPGGASIGLFLLAWTLAVVVALPALRRAPRALAAIAIAIGFAALQIESPKPLGALLFLFALGTAALSSRAGQADDAWRWAQRLAVMSVAGLAGPLRDAIRLLKRRKARPRTWRLLALVSLLALPVIGGAVFLSLFAAANPVIAEGLGKLRLPAPDVGRTIFWSLLLVIVWAPLRPWFQRHPLALPQARHDRLPLGVSVASVTLSLVVFNTLFALQNGLDIAFLWSGAPLPEGVTLAEYAHRGAYPLIATALLAGLFVLVALRPDTATAKARTIRWLVVLWVIQNLLLVASSILRTVDYIEVFSLTRFRIAALAWMALVGLGLVLICGRMLRAKSASWLINANVLAAGLVLTAASVVDLGAVAAAWNVRHAREVGGRGTALDLCYLNRLGPSAAVSLARLERTDIDAELKDRVAWARHRAVERLAREQADWRRWSWRGARRLEAVSGLLDGRPLEASHRAGERRCDGQIPLPPPTPPPAPAQTSVDRSEPPLTPTPEH